jgi:hypothetical protein
MRATRAMLTMGVTLLALAMLTGGCSDSDAPPLVQQGPGDDTGYQPGVVDVVIIDGTPWIVSGGSNSGDCIKVGDECVDIGDLKQQRCGDRDAQADIVIVDGQVVDVICYPPKSDGAPIDDLGVDGNGNVELPQNQNGAVITFDPATDGKELAGDVRLDAERVVLIGNGVDKSILGGNLTLASNNAKVRGVTVKGNLVLEKNANGTSITFCRIYGNLEIAANGVTVVNCDVYGNVEISGNNATLLGLRVAGTVNAGKGATCKGLVAIDDKNGDYVVDPGEVGAAISCK